jgi:ribose 5-phosphate isomerase RpiB
VGRSCQDIKLAVEHNDINVLCLAGTTPVADAVDMVETFLTTQFSRAPRHCKRIKMLSRL